MIIKRKIQLHEVDSAGLLFFANLFTLAHSCYEEIMESYGTPITKIIENKSYSLPIIHAEADYKLPIRHGDSLEISVQVDMIGNSSFTLLTKFIVNDNRETVAAQVRTVHVAINHEPIPLPAEIIELLHKISPENF
ncbi:MAG: acyl-CoA thioesterase [Thiotrichales bacterium]|jgi:1,4-dihydroxy-2-naphthoyl-CoA hydrolase|nr:acyl-CoA thioesterase [Thiotrichales bacterium]MBT3613038.1 acyl-CoA thioesterase [Thiotrichales bacterium]MBT3751940.1 acyl-CoA thioesterase [Thiotrichales bacterium]MBT3837644.1 acyl-CoA thioesterase [Thiotrichales bacterium]MBT4152318.1 acyl-CoA thioesterase [Thiotrichales bacterium]